MNRQQIKNKLNTILRNNASGLYSDDCWKPVHRVFSIIRNEGFVLNIINTRYGQDEKGNPSEKVWLLSVDMGTRKPITGILTAHGAGTVDEPLKKYDISAYFS